MTPNELTAFVLNTITTINKPTLFERLCELSKILLENDVPNYIAVHKKLCCLIYYENSHIAVIDNNYNQYGYSEILTIAKKHLKSNKIKLFMGEFKNGTYTKTRYN